MTMVNALLACHRRYPTTLPITLWYGSALPGKRGQVHVGMAWPEPLTLEKSSINLPSVRVQEPSLETGTKNK